MRVLLLGGTSEASDLARVLAGERRFTAMLSLAGVTRAPALPPIAHRIGGFGGIDGLAAWLRARRIEALIDATHPYAVRMTGNAAVAAGRLGIPLLRIARPPWTKQAGDRWTLVADAQAAASAIGPAARRILLTVGSKSLAPFTSASPHHAVIRCIDPPDPVLLPPGAVLLLARGPFDLASEIALLTCHRIDILVTKNSGGAATAPKLHAARKLGIDVVMIERPPEPSGTVAVTSAKHAIEWLRALPQGRSSQVMEANAPIHDPRAAKQT